jgi:MscS family membrane protein
VGAAIALATRESMENLIASFIIFFDKPFMTGDLVKGNTFTGFVEKIGLRSTRIRTLEKTYISVPNKQMVDTIIDNVSLRTQRKAEIRLELSLRATSEALISFLDSIRQMLGEYKEVENATVFLSDTGKNAHLIAIDFFAGMQMSIDEFNLLRETINLSIIKKLEAAKIDLAATNMDVVISQQ